MTNHKRTLILVNIIITCVACTLLMTALSTALPAINANLGIEATTGQWLISIYSLAMGVSMPLSAFLVRRFRTKRLYLASIGIVGIGLLIALFSVNFVMLLVGRVFQAVGNGLLMSMSQVVLLTIYPPEKRGMAMGWYGLAVGAAPVFAPTLGGILVDLISWRAIFGATLIFVVIAFVMACLVFTDALQTVEEKFDFLSFFLSILAFGGITLGVGNIATYGMTNVFTWLPLVIGVVTAVIFVWRQFSVEAPFLNLRVFKYKEFVLALVASMLLNLALRGAPVLMPLYVQDVLDKSAIVSGLVLLPGALANAIVSPFAGRLYDKIGMKKLFIPGVILVILGNLIMGLISINTTVVVSSICYIIRSIAFGCLLMPLVTWGTSNVQPQQVADATDLISTLRTNAGANGSAVFVGVMSMAATASGLEEPLASMHGVNVAFMVLAVTSCVLIIIAFFVKDRKKPATTQ